MSSRLRCAGAATLIAGLVATVLALAPTDPVGAEPTTPNTSGYVLTDVNSLLELSNVSATTIETVGTPATLTGLQPMEQLIAIDYRPANGALYALGLTQLDADDYRLRIHTIDPATAIANPVDTLDLNLGVAITDPSWGFDWNPVADKLRIVTAAGRNLAWDPEAATGAKFDLTPTALSAPGISGVAYTNNFGPGRAAPAGARATTLYGIDAAMDRLVAIEPPNSGTVAEIGPLAADITTNAEFDIASDGLALVVAELAGFETVWPLNLASGALGNPIAVITLPIRGLALKPGPSQLPTTPDVGYAVTRDTGHLVTFGLDSPSTATDHGPVTFDGQTAGFIVEGLDTRPATGELYALIRSVISPDLGGIATLDPSTRALSLIGGGAPFGLPAGPVGFDFNPVVDKIRLVAEGVSYRIDPTTGAAQSDVPPTKNGVATTLAATAYSNSAGPARGTIHFAVEVVDNATGLLYRFLDSNAGTLGTSVSSPPAVTNSGLDVARDGRTFLTTDSIVPATLVHVVNPVLGAAAPLDAFFPILADPPDTLIPPVRAFTTGPAPDPTVPVSITANDQTRVFGAANPELTFTATGVPDGESIDVPPTCTTTATVDSPAGTYPITCDLAADPAFTFTYTAGTLTITQAATRLDNTSPIRLGGGRPPAVDFRNVTTRLTTEAGAPVENALITFTAKGVLLCTDTTDADGVATCPLTRAGTAQLLRARGFTATFAGTTNLAGSTDTTGLHGPATPPPPPPPPPPPGGSFLQRLLALLAALRASF